MHLPAAGPLTGPEGRPRPLPWLPHAACSPVRHRARDLPSAGQTCPAILLLFVSYKWVGSGVTLILTQFPGCPLLRPGDLLGCTVPPLGQTPPPRVPTFLCPCSWEQWVGWGQEALSCPGWQASVTGWSLGCGGSYTPGGLSVLGEQEPWPVLSTQAWHLPSRHLAAATVRPLLYARGCCRCFRLSSRHSRSRRSVLCITLPL